MYNLEHKIWLDNEYSLWVKALQESTVHNFKEHPMVKRMLSEVDKSMFIEILSDKVLSLKEIGLLTVIDNIGRKEKTNISGTCLRMVHHVLKVLDHNPKSIVEIGGGVGQFYAILRALGYKGEYVILDLPEVTEFQWLYLDEVEKQTGLSLPINETDEFDFCISFYALGEFDNELKESYIKGTVNECRHGYIAWNAHSGATDDLTLFTRDIKVSQGRELNIKIIEW